MAKTEFILVIDQSTTASSAFLIDHHGKIFDKESIEFTQFYPRPGWVEHDAEEIWLGVCQSIDTLIKRNEDHAKIIAIGITNQRETTVVWNRKTGKPIHNAIVWQCRRTSEICNSLKKNDYENMIRSKTGLVLDPYFSATKVAWILDRVPMSRSSAENDQIAFGTIDSWILWNLTDRKNHITDLTNASRTSLFNIKTLDWDDDLLAIFRVPRSVLPTVQPSISIFGETKNLEFLPDGIPITGIAGDQQSALFGQLCTEPGSAKNTYGTGCFLLLNTGDQRIHSENGLITTLACGPDRNAIYALEGSVFVAGAAIQWLRDELKMITTAAESEKIAESVSDSGGVFVVPAFTGLGAPYWNADAKGAIFGLTRGTQIAHIVRATLEAIAFQSTELVSAMISDAKIDLQNLRVDGGATANNFLMQFQADLLGVAIERPKQIETTALGAAYLAGLSIGFWNSIDELSTEIELDATFQSQISDAERSEKLDAWRSAVRRIL